MFTYFYYIIQLKQKLNFFSFINKLAQYIALQEENKRRRDECIQLKGVLAHQSQSLRDLGSTNVKNDSDRIIHDNAELMDAFNAQKLVNR